MSVDSRELMSAKMYERLIEALLWLEKRESAKEPKEENQCFPGCPGWAVFDECRGMGLVVQRCDVCNRFKEDGAAMDHAMKRLGEEMFKKHWADVDKQEQEYMLENSTPLCISDNGISLTLRQDSGEGQKIGRYAVWVVHQRQSKATVAETSDDARYLQNRWGKDLPVVPIKSGE
jgi:hypothetical protein